MKSHLSYEHVKPLVASTEVQLAHLYVTFKCPVTGNETLSTARLADMTPVGGHPQRSGADFDRLAEARQTGSRALAGSRGLPLFGVPHADLNGPDGKPLDDPKKLAPDLVEHAIVRAFEAVLRRFRWDEAAGRYVGAP